MNKFILITSAGIALASSMVSAATTANPLPNKKQACPIEG